MSDRLDVHGGQIAAAALPADGGGEFAKPSDLRMSAISNFSVTEATSQKVSMIDDLKASLRTLDLGAGTSKAERPGSPTPSDLSAATTAYERSPPPVPVQRLKPNRADPELERDKSRYEAAKRSPNQPEAAKDSPYQRAVAEAKAGLQKTPRWMRTAVAHMQVHLKYGPTAALSATKIESQDKKIELDVAQLRSEVQTRSGASGKSTIVEVAAETRANAARNVTGKSVEQNLQAPRIKRLVPRSAETRPAPKGILRNAGVERGRDREDAARTSSAQPSEKTEANMRETLFAKPRSRGAVR